MPATSESSVRQFDLVILGTGSGNSIISQEFDEWSVAIVEEGVFGGTCLNRGCIPTKMLVHAADIAEHVRHAHRLGVDARVDGVRWRDIRDRVFGRIDPIAAGGDDYRSNRCPNVTVYRGRGRFVGERTISIRGADGTETVISGDRVVVSVGARPADPGIDGLSRVPFHTSDTIMRIDEIPGHLAVIGGGFIANELAHVFGSFGSKITMIHRGPTLLKEQDDEISSRFTTLVSQRPNFDVRLGTTVRSARHDGLFFRLDLSDGTMVTADTLLVATGRIPNTDTLHPEIAGLAVDRHGRLVVDEAQATSSPRVWALGDVSSPHMLKHVANHEARVVQHNLLADRRGSTERRQTDHRFVPSAVFTSPQIATVGLTERAARAAGYDIVVKVQNFGDTAYGWAMEDTTSVCKLIADRSTHLLLGAHLIGPHSAILVQQLIQGMSFGQTVDEIARGQYFIHPAMPEVVENALLGLVEAWS
jgi:mycothione reductase